MPSYSIIENFEVHKNNRFLEIAESLKPELLHKRNQGCKGNYGGKRPPDENGYLQKSTRLKICMQNI